ncbi:hypothetical protein RB195_012868 [Necator americanus]|uniref:Uncharacterized protein n=1 Tax=Necator americanus TaxID=51031 RepID=A0ABR1DTN2_NECAM
MNGPVGGDCTENCGRIYITGTHGNAGDFAKCRTASSLYITGSNLSTLSDFGQLRKISQTEDDECDMEVLLEAASTVGHVKNQKVNTPCVTLNGDLVINSSTNEALQSVIMGIRYIHGGISMVDTSWSELRLPSLETIDSNEDRSPSKIRIRPLKESLHESEEIRISGGVFVYGIVDYGKGDVGIEIRNNRNLTKIIIPFLRAILSTGKHANIIDNLKLRIDYALEERLLLTRMRKGSEENRLEIKTSPCVINETESLISLASCRNVVGDIIITAANSEISILENLAFFVTAPILIEDNKQLVDIDLGIHRVRSTLRKPLEIKDALEFRE